MTTTTIQAHVFRPIPGNAVFCADCPPGDSVQEKGTRRHVGTPIALDVAVTALERTPTEMLVQVLRERNLTHGTHNALRSYGPNPSACFVCGQSIDQRLDVFGQARR